MAGFGDLVEAGGKRPLVRERTAPFAAVVNFPPKQIGPFVSECLVTGFPDENGNVALCVPDKQVPIGAKLF